MEIKLLNEELNPLFNRREVRFEVIHANESTPKLTDVRFALAQKLGADSSHIIIDGFKTLFGINRSVGDARIYKNMNDLKDYEPAYLLKRNKLIQEKKEEGSVDGEEKEEGNKETEEAA